MAADRRRFAWVNAVLASFVGLAVLLAPVASAQAMRCHEPPAHGQMDLEHSFILNKNAHISLQGGLHTSDHKACCTIQCGFCVVLASMDRTEVPPATGSFFHFAWGDQTGSGLVLPPTLGPPRLPL
ncbi:hypothetical protein ABID08_005515 [Rhizobium binae]|uniref:DUF2946 domain-containing protein n=1 Tax=Rhizobium binae TaxID=1138190 RepID=A0ABV2MNU9_9HYPH|nr:hypothetical protein [Rhizobium binae]MBX4995419.1 hypothetical protein [Rhizobium binae]NKL51010.1 hypothetical protein [Rhizobium leguminosarum bv. viciae]QSY85586.1 hypothetical protein J2J99_28845 [Rhizobium binae]